MKIFLLKENSIDTTDFLFNWVMEQTGFFFETDIHNLRDCNLILCYGNPEFRQLTKDYSLPQINIPYYDISSSKPTKDNSTCLYINNAPCIPVWGKIEKNKNAEGFISQNYAFDFGPAISISEDNEKVTFTFDIINNILFHLLREEEKKSNKQELFKAEHSILEPMLAVPVVDYMITMLKQTIISTAEYFGRALLMKARWPSGKKFAFVLTHDIDLTRKWGPKSVTVNFFKNLLTLNISGLKTLFHELLFKSNSYWTFPRLLELYENNHWNSTFFFLAKSFEKFSYRYNISNRKFIKLFTQLIDSGHEIGLHPSKYVFGSHSKTKNELHKLKYFSRSQIYGVRQHYLNLHFPEAFAFFSELKFLYDSSMAYSKKPGFRAGTSLPYPANRREKCEFYEIPFVFFDYHVPRLDDFNIFFEQLLQNIKNIEGVLHILWHPSNLAEPSLSETFYYIVRNLYENHQDGYNFNLKEITEWNQKWRNIELKILGKNKNDFRIALIGKEELRNLQISLVGLSGHVTMNEPHEMVETDAINIDLTPNTSGIINISIG